MPENLVCEVGSVVQTDPELKFTTSGLALTTFSIRVKNKDEEARFVKCVAWRDLGENVAESIRKGDRVIVRGILKTREYDKQDGTRGVSTELNAWNVGPDLSYATATVVRNERTDDREPVAATPDF